MSGGRPDRDAVVRYLAHQAVTWHLLHVYRHHGLAGAVATLSVVGGCGRGVDDVFRVWETEAGGRTLAYREGSMRAPVVRVPLREVLDWADRRLTPTQWRRIEELAVARDAPTPGLPRGEWMRSPSERTPEVNALIYAADRRRAAIERELAQILHTALVGQPRAGEQLDLFTDAEM